MDAGERGRGSPLTKPKVEGYTRRYWDPINKRPAATRIAKVTFRALTENLKSHIYDMGTGSQTNQFITNTKALDSYYGRKCTNPQDIRISIERQKYVVVPIPSTSTDIDEDVVKLLLGKEINAYVKRAQQ